MHLAINPSISIQGTTKWPNQNFIVIRKLVAVFAAHTLCACETEPSDLSSLRESTTVVLLLLLYCARYMIFGRK